MADSLENYAVEALPQGWSAWNFHRKVAWLEAHSRPRMPYREACRWLSRRSAVARAARRKEVRRGC